VAADYNLMSLMNASMNVPWQVDFCFCFSVVNSFLIRSVVWVEDLLDRDLDRDLLLLQGKDVGIYHVVRIQEKVDQRQIALDHALIWRMRCLFLPFGGLRMLWRWVKYLVNEWVLGSGC
jgi:hypothetical protein